MRDAITLQILLVVILVATFTGLSGDPVAANPLNNWTISCGADPGAISRSGGVWTFRTSRNRCKGGTFAQRAEVNTDSISPSAKGAYLFETNVTMTSGSIQQFTIFQVHDGRFGCAPPLSIDVTPNGRLLLKSDIKTGEGENCIRGALNEKLSRGTVRRDGTEQKLTVLVDFDGKGGFAVQVWIDGVAQISGRYDPLKQPDAFKSKKFYLKHGVYSQRMFEYVMTSRGMKVSRVKLSN